MHFFYFLFFFISFCRYWESTGGSKRGGEGEEVRRREGGKRGLYARRKGRWAKSWAELRKKKNHHTLQIRETEFPPLYLSWVLVFFFDLSCNLHMLTCFVVSFVFFFHCDQGLEYFVFSFFDHECEWTWLLFFLFLLGLFGLFFSQTLRWSVEGWHNRGLQLREWRSGPIP